MKLLKKRRIEKSYLIVVGIISLFVVIGYFSYAMFTVNKEQKEAIRIITGTLPATLSSEDKEFKDNKITVPKDSSKDITITLTNNNDRNAKYNFYYKDNINENVTIGYTYESKDTPPLKKGVIINSKESQSYTIRIKNENKEDITVEFGSIGGLENKELSFPSNSKYLLPYIEKDKSGANAPVLSDNMIPVVYNGKTWVKKSSDYYNYDKQEWANAVTVTNGSRETYKNAEAGEEVKMDDILQMWVWIPRYSYTIKSEDGKNYYGKKEEEREDEPTQALPGEIDVKFISSSITDEGSARYTGDIVEGWYTPSGFTLGEKNLSGIWIGKFETGYMGANTTTEAEHDTEEPNKAIIKPNVYSWRLIRVSTLELVSMGITKVGNIYGFDQSTYDAHASKNTEWALISYLTQSKYGKYGNSLYAGENKQVYMNNYKAYMTGCSSGQGTAEASETYTYKYDDLVDRGKGQGYGGGGSSSTGNITGIYDTNGGAWEYVMSVLDMKSGQTASLNSGYPGQLADGSSFTSDRVWPQEIYYDLYTSDEVNKFYKGHALNEIGVWYDDRSNGVDFYNPWLSRSGSWSYNEQSGTFAYGPWTGQAGVTNSFRIVLTPQ